MRNLHFFACLGVVLLVFQLGSCGKRTGKLDNQILVSYPEPIDTVIGGLMPQSETGLSRIDTSLISCIFPEIDPYQDSLKVGIKIHSDSLFQEILFLRLNVSTIYGMDTLPSYKDSNNNAETGGRQIVGVIHRGQWIDSLYRPLTRHSIFQIPNIFYFDELKEGTHVISCGYILKEDANQDTIIFYNQKMKFTYEDLVLSE